MDDASITAAAPPGWLEALAESEAELEAGLLVPGDDVMRDLREAIGRLESLHAGRPVDETVPRR